MFSFPNPVNEVAARLVAAGVVVLCALTVALDQPWMTALIAYGFVARVLTGPTLSPLAQLVTRVVVPALGLEAREVPGPPKRFAQGIGAVFTTAAAILALGFGQTGAAYALLGVIIAFATLESVAGLCVGCKVFQVLMRAGVVPESVCESCADIWRVSPDSPGAPSPGR